jgi:glyoxylase-like metal-dependent hydrolase (beta-lactamase superfamily II)
MAQYKIHVLKVADFTVPLTMISLVGDLNSTITGPVFIWYIEGDGKKILMDAGVAAPDAHGLTHGFPVVGGGEEGVRKALASVGTTPEEIDILVLSHLHIDHCSEVALFENSRIFVQKREWETAFNPIPTMRAIYDSSLFAPLERLDLAIIDGDHAIADGVTALLAPGHTQGNMGLAISTAMGTVVLAGDACYSNYNLDPLLTEVVDFTGKRFEFPPRPDLPFRPQPAHVNLTEWFDSMWKLVAAASSRSLVFPGHEVTLVGRVIG